MCSSTAPDVHFTWETALSKRSICPKARMIVGVFERPQTCLQRRGVADSDVGVLMRCQYLRRLAVLLASPLTLGALCAACGVSDNTRVSVFETGVTPATAGGWSAGGGDYGGGGEWGGGGDWGGGG